MAANDLQVSVSGTEENQRSSQVLLYYILYYILIFTIYW